MLIAWRLLRADAVAGVVGGAAGLANDLITGAPIGLSVALWTAIMLGSTSSTGARCGAIIGSNGRSRRCCIAARRWRQWQVAGMVRRRVAASRMIAAADRSIAILCFPVAAWLVARLDRWRLGR